MFVACSSAVTIPKSVFFCVNLRAKFELVPQKQFLSISTVKLANSEKIRQVYSSEILSITATIREENSTEIDSVFT